MKKQLHLSALLFTTLLLLFAFPQVGRGQESSTIRLTLCGDSYNKSMSDITTAVYEWFNDDSNVNMNGVKSITIAYDHNGGGELDQEWIDLLKKRIKEAAATLTEVNLGHDDNPTYYITINATDLSDLFKDCEKLDSVKMGSIDKTCTNLNNCFNGCKQLKKIEFGGLPNGRTSCEGMFQGCTNLEKIIGAFSSIKSTTWKNAFNGCSKLDGIKLGFAENGSFEKDGLVGTFNGCNSLDSINLSGLKNATLNSLDSTFYGCWSARYIILPKDITADGISLQHTFEECGTFKQVDVYGDYATSANATPLYWKINTKSDGSGTWEDCYAIDVPATPDWHHFIKDNANNIWPTPFVTCGTGQNVTTQSEIKTPSGITFLAGQYLLKNNSLGHFTASTQSASNPEFILPGVGNTYELVTTYSNISEVLNDGYDVPVVVKNPKLASPATFYLTIKNCANGSGVPNVVDILDNPPAISAKDVVIITDPTLVGIYSFTPNSLDINSASVSYDSSANKLEGSFHLTTDATFALHDASGKAIKVEISELPGEYYLVPAGSAATSLKDINNSDVSVSDASSLSVYLPGAYFLTDNQWYGLSLQDDEPIMVGFVDPNSLASSIFYPAIPKSNELLFQYVDFVQTPTAGTGRYYIQGSLQTCNGNVGILEPTWAPEITASYCGIYNINKLENISSMVGTFKNCTNLVFGVDNAGSDEGNFCSKQAHARLDCKEAFYGVKSFKTFTNGSFSAEKAIDLTMFKDIESLNSTFRNGGTKVQFYTGTQADWSEAQGNPVDMQYAFCGHTGYQQGDVLDVPFKNISSLYFAFGGDCSIGNICFNSADQDPSKDPSAVSCHIQRAFDGNKGLTKLSDETLKNFKRFKSLYSKDGNKPNNSVLNRLTYTFAHCANLNEVDLSKNATGAWLSKPADDGELELLYTFIQCVKLEKADLSGIMDYTKSLDGTFDQCAGLLTCTLGERTDSLSMSSTFWGNTLLQTVKTRNTSVNNMIDLGGLQCITNLAQTFTKCENIKQIKFADNLNNATGIALKSTFSGCTSLEKVDLTALTPHLKNTEVVVYTTNQRLIAPTSTNSNASAFDNTFYGCTALQTVTFADGVSNENPIGMPSTFLGCKKLLTVENLDAFKRLTDLNQTFSGCEQLGKVEFDVASTAHTVQHLYRTFFNCKNIQKINLGSISNKLQDIINPTSKVDPKTLAFGQTFFGCEALETVTFGSDPNINPVSMCGTFYGCAKLTGLTNIDKFTNITNLSQTFSGCAALPDVSFIAGMVNNNPSTSIGLFETFKGCKSITSIDLSALTARLADQKKANFFQANNNDIINGAFAAFEGTFDGCTALTDVEFDKGTSDGTSTNPLINANSIGMPGTFSGCANLQTVKNLTAFQNLTQLNHTFYGCSKLNGIQFSVSNAHAASMSLFGTFTNCSALTEITLPFVIGEQNISQTRGNTTSSVTYSAFGDNPIGDNPNKTFAGCTSLKKVEFNGKDNSNQVNVDNLFRGLSQLDTVANFDKFHVLKDGSLKNTFYGCSALDSIKLSAKLSEASTSYSLNSTFYGCEELATIVNFDKLTQVGDLTSTFEGCEKLDTLYFGFDPSKVSQAENTFFDANKNGKKYLDCAWDKHDTWKGYATAGQVQYQDANFIFEERYNATHQKTTFTVFDCDTFDVKPQLQTTGDVVVEFVNIVKDGTAYTPDAKGKYLVAGTDTCGTITATATQITDIKLTASGTYDFHYRTENGGKGHCNKQAAINLTLGNSDKHDVVGTVCEDEEFTWNTGLGSTAIVLTPTDYNAPVSAAPPTNGSRLKLSKGSAIIDATGKKSREETYKYYKQVKDIAGKACEESSTLTLTVRLLDTITTTVTNATCVCSTLSYAWTVENGNIITINESAFGGAATSSSWTRTNNPNGHVMFEHQGVDTSDPHSCNTVYRLVFEKPYTPIEETNTETVTHCQEYAYQWDLTPANSADDEYLNLSGADFDPTCTNWNVAVNAINSPSHTYDKSNVNLILSSGRTQSAIVNEMVTYTFTVKLQNANTCVDTYKLTLPVKLTHRNEQTDTVCEEANYVWRDNAGKVITTLDKGDFNQCLDHTQYGKYQPLTHDPALDIDKMVVDVKTENGRRLRTEIYKYYAQRENCTTGACEISDSLMLTVELVDTITTTVTDATCVCPDLSYAWTVENDAIITIDEAAFAPNATSALWMRTDNHGSVTFEHSGTINNHLCATVYQLIFDKPTKPINDVKTDKTCESEPYKWDLGSSGAAIALSGNDFVNAPTWTVSAFTSSGTYSAVTSAERTLKAQLPATEQMTFTYKVTLLNNQTACEDTYTLDLTVQQTHREQTTAQVCANVEYELKNVWGAVVLTLGSSEYNMGDVAANSFSNAGGSGTFSKTTLPNGTQRYVVSKTGGTQYGCLEEYTLDLTVNPVYDERPGGPDAANATTGTICQNEDFVWNIAGDALVSAITLTYADYNQTATVFNSAGQQLQLDKTTNGTTQCYTYKGADKNTHCDRFYYLTLTVSPVIDQTLYSPYTDATQMAYCSDQTYVWNDGGFSYYLDSVQFYRPDGVYTDNGITIEQTTISATPWIVQFVATVPSGSCQAKYKLLLALDDRFAANLVLANTVTDAVCNGSSYVWNYGSDGSVTVSPADPDYPAFPAGGQIKRRVSVPGASGCNDYYYLDLTINPSDHRTMTIDAVCRDENYFSYTGFPINEIVDFDAADLPADVKTYTHTVAHDCDQMTITFNFKEPERCQGKIVEGLVINQYECWLLMVNHNHLPLLDQEPVAYQWYVCHNTAPGDPNFLRNSNPIEGANKDFYTETQTLTGGYYWVKVTYIVGGEEFYYRSEPAALTCTDALEVVTTTELMLSPNPVKQGSFVVVEGDAIDKMADGAHVDIYTTAGQRVRSFDIGGRAFKVDVPAGCYMVKISVDGQTIVTTKMVVR